MKKIIITFENPVDELTFLNIIEKYKLTDFINDEFDLVNKNVVDHEVNIDGEGNVLLHYTSEKEDIEPVEENIEDDIENDITDVEFEEESSTNDY